MCLGHLEHLAHRSHEGHFAGVNADVNALKCSKASVNVRFTWPELCYLSMLTQTNRVTRGLFCLGSGFYLLLCL